MPFTQNKKENIKEVNSQAETQQMVNKAVGARVEGGAMNIYFKHSTQSVLEGFGEEVEEYEEETYHFNECDHSNSLYPECSKKGFCQSNESKNKREEELKKAIARNKEYKKKKDSIRTETQKKKDETQKKNDDAYIAEYIEKVGPIDRFL